MNMLLIILYGSRFEELVVFRLLNEDIYEECIATEFEELH